MPPEIPAPTSPDAAARDAVIVVVIVAVVVIVVREAVGVRVRGGVADAPPDDPDPDADDEQSRDEVEPGVELLGRKRRERQRHESEREDADRVRHRHDAAEGERVACAPTRSPRGSRPRSPCRGPAQRVRGAPEAASRSETARKPGVRSRDERLEAARLVVAGSEPIEAPPRASRLVGRGRRPDVERLAEQIGG